jgi:hypothetical protein
MPCGTDYVTMMVIHPNDDTLSGLYVGQKFTRKQAMFTEGMDGATSNHFHISVGTGHFTGLGWEQNSKNEWVLVTTGTPLKPENAFYIDHTFTTNVMDAKGLSFQNMP